MTFNIELTPIQFDAANGDKFKVFPVIKNQTNNEATDTVELVIGEKVRSSRTLTLSAGGSETIKLVWDVSVESNKEMPITVRTSSDSASDEATFRLFNDTVRVRFNEDTREADESHDESFIKDTTRTGLNID